MITDFRNGILNSINRKGMQIESNRENTTQVTDRQWHFDFMDSLRITQHLAVSQRFQPFFHLILIFVIPFVSTKQSFKLTS